MTRYIIKRLLLMIPVLIGVSLIVFCISGVNTDPIIFSIGGEEMSNEEYLELKHELGFDEPVLVRYVKYMSGMLRGDLGKSHISGNDVFQTYKDKIPVTVNLAFYSVLVSIILSIPLGIISALKSGSLTDNVGMFFALLGLSIPNFWLGLMLIIGFSLKLGWFPTMATQEGGMFLPSLSLSLYPMAYITRLERSAMLDVLGQDYIRTAKAKGLKNGKIIFKHALKNALSPVITYAGPMMAYILTGSMVVENIYSVPGLGRLFVNSMLRTDYMMIMGVTIFLAAMIILMNFLSDILYKIVDPRIDLS